MECKRVVFSGHAVRRMFERGITGTEVLDVVQHGEVITEYPEDEPFPSFLMLGIAGDRPLHVVVAVDTESQMCYIVTVYEPDPNSWTIDFRKRR
jgi:hypothetical protein